MLEKSKWTLNHINGKTSIGTEVKYHLYIDGSFDRIYDSREDAIKAGENELVAPRKPWELPVKEYRVEEARYDYYVINGQITGYWVA